MKCEIIRDLLPLYIDGLTSKESNQEIEKHLKNCEECQKYYQPAAAFHPVRALLQVKYPPLLFLGKSPLPQVLQLQLEGQIPIPSCGHMPATD